MNASLAAPVRSAPATAPRFVARCAWTAVLWFLLNGTDWNSWIVGGPTVLVAAWLSIRLLPDTSWRWSIGGAVRFFAYFLRESWRGAWIVSRQALSAELKISPGLLRYRLHLPPGPARWLFCNTISLLPGTAVVAIEGECLCVHVLDLSVDSTADLKDLERRVAALFGIAWNEKEEGKS